MTKEMFLREDRDNSDYVDGVFSIAAKAKADNDPSKINATVGALYSDEGKIYTYKSVFDCLDKVPTSIKAAYANGSAGNAKFNKEVADYVLEGKVKNYSYIPTAGGTAAISLAMNTLVKPGDTILVPAISWGNYKLMAKEFKLNVSEYDVYDLDGLFKKVDEVEKVFVIINSPCENPLGHSYSYSDWEKIIDKFNNCGKEVVLVNDVAYMDYSYGSDYKRYFELYNKLNDNILVLIAYSCSKVFSYYGMRMGLMIAIHNNKEFLNHLINQFGKYIRTIYSSINAGGMESIADLLANHKDEFNKEKQGMVDLLAKRSKLFLDEAKKVGLEHYPYNEGFFITLKFNDNESRDKVHAKLMDNHIYTVKVNKGIRVAICSVPSDVIVDLVDRIKETI